MLLAQSQANKTVLAGKKGLFPVPGHHLFNLSQYPPLLSRCLTRRNSCHDILPAYDRRSSSQGPSLTMSLGSVVLESREAEQSPEPSLPLQMTRVCLGQDDQQPLAAGSTWYKIQSGSHETQLLLQDDARQRSSLWPQSYVCVSFVGLWLEAVSLTATHAAPCGMP